jgi:HNH endonuclease
VIHATAESLASDDRSCEIEGGGVVHAETVRRLACAGRHQIVLEDADRNAVDMGKVSSDPSPATLRQLRYRDRECRFPGCGARRFTQAHHIRWRSRGGRHNLENLVLVCTFHHKLVHEHGWGLARDADNTVRWHRPDGSRYTAGPAPPQRLLAAG